MNLCNQSGECGVLFARRVRWQLFIYLCVCHKCRYVNEGEIIMKKTLALSLMAITLLFGSVVSTASAKTAASSTVQFQRYRNYPAYPQRRWDRGDRRGRTRYVTRTEWYGGRVYRVTYRITSMWDGRTYSQIVNRVRIR